MFTNLVKNVTTYVVTPFPNKPPEVKIINNTISPMSTATDKEETMETHSW